MAVALSRELDRVSKKPRCDGFVQNVKKIPRLFWIPDICFLRFLGHFRVLHKIRTLVQEFVSSHGYIHRDLAARNVLLRSGPTAKIADFGLCRYTDGELYVAYQEANLPTRWMALESLKSATFSTLSDM